MHEFVWVSHRRHPSPHRRPLFLRLKPPVQLRHLHLEQYFAHHQWQLLLDLHSLQKTRSLEANHCGDIFYVKSQLITDRCNGLGLPFDTVDRRVTVVGEGGSLVKRAI